MNSSYKPKLAAQNALAGKCHYVDDETLKLFNSKVNDAGPILDGLFYFIARVKTPIDVERIHDYKYFDIWAHCPRDGQEVDEP